MKQKLLTLFVLLVSAMTAFADATGSGVTKGNDSNKNGISYEYQFTEQDGNVTFTVTPNTDGIIGYAGTYIDDESHLQGDYETKGTTRTWKGLAKGTTIKVKGWFDAAGRMYFDEVTYTTGTEAAPDTEKPVMVKADATTIRDTRATLTLLANDDSNGLLTYKVTIGDNSYTVKGNAGKDVTIDIPGLTAKTKYDFSVTATDKANNVSEAKIGSFTTTTAFTLTAPTAPTVDASKVISVLSAAYTPATTWKFGGWGQSTVSENIDVDGTPVIHLSKFNYIGLDNFSNQLDLSGMTHMHIDVMPITMTGSLGVTPILKKGDTKFEKLIKVGDNTTLKLRQWNAIDMPLSDFGLDFINNKVFQIKFDKGNNATDELYIANIYFYNKSVGEQTLQSITINNSFTGATSTLNTTVTPKASDGTVFNGTVTYTISDGAHLTAEGNNLTITADAAGTYTLTATSGTNTATTQVYFVGSAPTPTEAAENVLAYYSDQYTVENIEEYNSGWEKGWATSTDINLSATDQAKCVTGVGTWGLTKGPQDMTLYTKFCADIYAFENIPYRITFEKSSIPEATGTLKNGWNHIEVPFNDAARTGMEYIKFNIGTDAKHDYTVLFDNIYATKADIKFNITTSGNVAKVVGPITAAEVEQINNVDAMNIDLTGVTTIEDGITIKPLRKNAIIVATGSVADDVYSADSKYDAIKDMANLVVLVNGYYHPIKQLEFVDIPGEPFWTGGLRDLNDFISTGNTGWKVTRTIPAHTHATVCVTNAIVNIPANLRAWEAVDYDETTGIKFNKANVIGANFPYVVRNATDEGTDLSFTGTNDLNFKTIMDTEASKQKVGSTNISFCGNWKEALVTNGTQWIIKNEGINASIVKANGVKISPFRAYFTGIPEGASAKLNFNDEETTGITNVNAAESNDDTLYNLAGQKVNAAYKGIVIKNGKKYLVK